MLEIIIDGSPRSLNGSTAGLRSWKSFVADCARASVAPEDRIDHVDVTIRILHFCRKWNERGADLDNIAKPIIDGICGVAIFNDNQVREILLRRTDVEQHTVTVSQPSPKLSGRLEALLRDATDPGFVYVSVEATIDEERVP
jgi:hypothetical protein